MTTGLELTNASISPEAIGADFVAFRGAQAACCSAEFDRGRVREREWFFRIVLSLYIPAQVRQRAKKLTTWAVVSTSPRVRRILIVAAQMERTHIAPPADDISPCSRREADGWEDEVWPKSARGFRTSYASPKPPLEGYR